MSKQGTSPHWYILGAGAIGGLWASHAWRNERPMTLILRDSLRLAQYRRQGEMKLALLSGLIESLTVPASCPDEITTPISHLLICTKAQQTLGALQQLESRLAPDVRIVLLQNGLGVAEQVRAAFPNATLFQASTTEGAYREGDFSIVEAGRGATLIGPPGEMSPNQSHNESEQIAQQLSVSPLTVKVVDNIQEILWRKLAINCAINPLTVKYRCRNGELLDNLQAMQEIAVLVDEILLLSKTMNREHWVEGLLAQVHQVARNTALNRSSMLQDIEARRTTEIDFITGHLLATATKCGLELPANRALYEQIQAIQHA